MNSHSFKRTAALVVALTSGLGAPAAWAQYSPHAQVPQAPGGVTGYQPAGTYGYQPPTGYLPAPGTPLQYHAPGTAQMPVAGQVPVAKRLPTTTAAQMPATNQFPVTAQRFTPTPVPVTGVNHLMMPRLAQNQNAETEANADTAPAGNGAEPAASAATTTPAESLSPAFGTAPNMSGVGAAGYATGNYGWGGSGYAASDNTNCGISNEQCGESKNQWFVGVYGLFMERDDSTNLRTNMVIDTTTATFPYYPNSNTSLQGDMDYDWQGGAEIRFGSTFGTAASCACQCGYGGYGCGASYGGAGCGTTGPAYAWEAVYWGLAEDDQSLLRVDTIAGNNRMYTMIDFTGLEYDRGLGAGYLPVNTYVDYQNPAQTPVAGDIIVTAQHVRTRFTAQNLEVNFFRLPVCGGGPTYGNCGGCGNAGACGCEPGCGSDSCSGGKFTVTAMCGARYMRLDDDFALATEFADPGVPDADYVGFDYGSDNELFYDINVDNHLTGLQLGCNMDWILDDCWTLFTNTQFGIFGNHIKHDQRMYAGGGGPVRYAGTQQAFYSGTSKDDLAFIGEIKAGGAYRISPNCRLTLAYRAVALSGVALSVNQIPTVFDHSSTVGRIDSNESLILHGVQAGAEFKF